MHYIIKHISKYFGITLMTLFFSLLGVNANSEQSAEETIKARKALFSKNYNTAKRVQALSSSGKFNDAKKLMTEMSKNYETLLSMFPDNTQEGHKTESLPIIWVEKDAFNSLMQKSSDDMIKLSSLIETSDDIRSTLGQFMWSNCKACHSKYRAEH